MKNKKTLILSAFIIVIAVFLSVCFGVIIPSIKINETSSMAPTTVVNKNYEDNKDESSEENKDDVNSSVQPDTGESETAKPVKNELDFFVYDRAVTKSKEICGETTTFEINFRVFVTNNSNEQKNILANAFSSNYEIENNALFYTFECTDVEKSVQLGANQTQDFNFTLTYIITDTEEFKVTDKHNLAVSYMLKEVLSLEV